MKLSDYQHIIENDKLIAGQETIVIDNRKNESAECTSLDLNQFETLPQLFSTVSKNLQRFIVNGIFMN